MKIYCNCEDWEYTMPHWEKEINPFNSSATNIPMYFGKPIYYCPWCGKKLEEKQK